MPKSKIIYIGVLVIAATALMWLGGFLLQQIQYIFPFSAGVGAALIVIGLFVELRKNKLEKDQNPSGGSPEPD